MRPVFVPKITDSELRLSRLAFELPRPVSGTREALAVIPRRTGGMSTDDVPET
jgi:hypothetical protein